MRIDYRGLHIILSRTVKLYINSPNVVVVHWTSILTTNSTFEDDTHLLISIAKANSPYDECEQSEVWRQ